MRLPRWLKVSLLGLGGTVGVLLLVVFLVRASFDRSGRKELDRTVAALDAGDPGWRLNDILAAREKAAPPPERNPAVAGVRVREAFSPDWEAFRNTRDFGGPVSNEHPGFWALAWYLQAGALTGEAREAARTTFLRPEVAGTPNGYTPLTVPDNPIATLLPHVQKTRDVFEVLDLDARLAALEGRPVRGVAAARAGLVATRAVGDEPFLISQLVRMAGANVAATGAMQLLAWAEPKAGLAELQADLRKEADTPWVLTGLRGERGMMDKLFDGLENGKISPKDGLAMMGERPNPLLAAGFELYRGFLPGDRAMSLKLLTEMMEAAKKPHHERKKVFADIKYPWADGNQYRYIITRLIVPACNKVSEAETRTRAQLLTASAAVACERFRQKTGRWPESLDEIPVDILPPLPPDPYTGGPIQFRRVADGVLVFCQADDLQLTARAVGTAEDPDPLDGIGRGWKLWDPDRRGVTREAKELPPPLPDGPDGGENP